jgi:hypothetical protein
LFLAVFFVLEFTCPRFPHGDEIVFKSAGWNLSQGVAFAAPELEGLFTNMWSGWRTHMLWKRYKPEEIAAKL